MFWCPRCGTLVQQTGPNWQHVGVPKLVDCTRGFVRMIDDTAAGRWLKQQAEVSGILEAAHKPGDR